MKKTFLFIVLIGIMLGIGIWIFKTNNDSLNYQAQRSSTNKNNLDEIDIKSTQSTTDTQQVTEQTEKEIANFSTKIHNKEKARQNNMRITCDSLTNTEIKPEEILAELERITQKDLECIYITTNAFDIYLNDASSLKMDTNKGITGIYFNTNVNMEKFKVDSIEKLVHATEAFDMFTEYYDEDDEYDYYRIDFKDSEVKIFFNNEL